MVDGIEGLTEVKSGNDSAVGRFLLVESIGDVICQENEGRGGRVTGSKTVLVSGECKVSVDDW